MKITKARLKEIIQEELEAVLSEREQGSQGTDDEELGEGLGASAGTSTRVQRPGNPGPPARFKKGPGYKRDDDDGDEEGDEEEIEEGAPTPPYAKPGQAAAKKASYTGRPGTYGSGGTGGSGAQAKMAGNPASAKRDDKKKKKGDE